MSKFNMDLTQEELKRQITYCPITGQFNWNERKGGRPGDGCIGRSWNAGYQRARINGKSYQLNRLAWLYVYGYLPPGLVDHKNHIVTDNRIENLRLATVQQNNMNRRIGSANRSGIKGVSWNCRSKKWQCFVGVGGKNINVGSFSDLEEAARAVEAARERLHGEFACHGSPS